MKAIVSHDVDHLTAWEHVRDGALLRFLARSTMQAATRGIPARVAAGRLSEIARNRWHNLDELAEFDRHMDIPSTFFFGMARGLGMSYGAAAARPWIRRLKDAGFDVGVHGIAYDDAPGIGAEAAAFREASGIASFGIRMHYLRHAPETPRLLEAAGYLFDSTREALGAPCVHGRMVEFPVAVMDARIMYPSGGLNPVPLDEAKAATLRIVARAEAAALPYLTVLFHDRYFSDRFPEWRAWYVWLVDHLRERGIRFAGFRQAVAEVRGMAAEAAA